MAAIAAGLSALAASLNALSSTKLAVVPLAAGLAAGVAVGSTYFAPEAPTESTKAVVAGINAAPVIAPPPVTIVPDARPAAAPVVTAKTETKTDIPCNAQTWPYIDAKCRIGQAGADRKVRLVTPARASDAPTEAEQSSDMARRENPGLVSSGTVLHTPQPLAEERKVTKRSAKRETRRERRVSEQYYEVPAEYGRGSARIVVRPLRIDPYR